MWLAAIPLLFIPACWLYWWLSVLEPGLAIGRSAALLLVIGAALAAYAPAGARRDPAVPRWRALLANPVAWCVAALIWQLAVWAVAAPVREPGLPWLVERAAALATACGVAWWLAGRDLPRAAWGLAGAGSLTLLITAIGVQPTDRPEEQRLGDLLRLGREPPFGNPNFGVGAAIPLLALSLGLWWRERQAGPARAFHALLALGWLAAIALMIGLSLGDGVHLHGNAVRSGALGAGAALALLLVCAAPARLQLPLALLGALALWGGEVAVTHGAIPLGEHAAPSTIQRVFLWRTAAEAIAAAPVAGYGAGAAVAILPLQPSFAAAWLAVPSYAEHAHHEVLEILLDGGAVNLVLLALALVTTLWPLWQRRGEALPLALLAAWAAVIAQANVESHLSQPGAVLLLALLAGLSWACVREGAPPAELPRRLLLARRAACGGAVAALGIYVACELAHVTGAVGELQRRWELRVEPARQEHEWPLVVGETRDLRRRVGTLADLPFEEARAEAMLADSLRREPSSEELRTAAYARAEAAATVEAALLPVHPWALDLLERLRRRREAAGDAEAARALAATLAEARARARELFARVPENVKNHQVRELLEKQLEPPVSAPAPSAP